jgi:hypothetical protein
MVFFRCVAARFIALDRFVKRFDGAINRAATKGLDIEHFFDYTVL